MEASAILQPVFVVGLLTAVMGLWMAVTRVPAMNRMGIHPQKAQDTSNLKELLPKEVMRISNNYNHLFEQPTLFYAVAISIAVLGHVDAFYVGCAWTYAGLRIVHSLVQATVDIVLLRFGIFILSWVVLGIMLIRETLAVF
ncbi:MAPEG family protein [Aestuariirhabdus sp. LZHN29]|uniref:MAPEG family protein n=1 Tax=Aestuariirhabdus sp. LZHN29 TaxID=3417462 RepID=UPI003CF67D43